MGRRRALAFPGPGAEAARKLGRRVREGLSGLGCRAPAPSPPVPSRARAGAVLGRAGAQAGGQAVRKGLMSLVLEIFSGLELLRETQAPHSRSGG